MTCAGWTASARQGIWDGSPPFLDTYHFNTFLIPDRYYCCMAEPDNIDWGKVGFVDSSTYRKEVLSLLVESRLTPKELSEETPIELSHISRTLKQLKEKDLVELLVPEEQQKGRIHGATEEGKQVWDAVESRN